MRSLPRPSLPTTRHQLLAGLGALLLPTLATNPATAQDFSTLSELHASDRAERVVERQVPVAPRVLIAGDSWAQFMWDDAVHATVLDRFGLAENEAISLSLGSDPGPGYTGPEVAISGSEARQWADTANYPWIANVVALLQAYPTIDHVVLSLGGNDVLAGRSGSGWYKDMDLDVPGSEAAFFDQLEADTRTVIDAVLAVRPEIRVMLSSYDYPNFDVGLWCFLYACPKREDLSRDPVGDLITNAELNQLMIDVETRRRAWAAADPRVVLDNSIGLMHHVYGDGIDGPRVLPRPGRVAPDYEPFPGGNPLRPTLRANFRLAGGFDADPIHLTAEGYRHKASQQVWAHLLRAFVPEPDLRLQSSGGDGDGWTDGVDVSDPASESSLAVGDDGVRRVAAVLHFDTSAIEPGVTVTGATLWLTRTDGGVVNPFTSGALGAPRLDLAAGGFGVAGVVEPGDLDAPADREDVGHFVGSVSGDGSTLRIDLDPSALDLLTPGGPLEARISFPAVDLGTDLVIFADGDAGDWTPMGPATFAETLGSAAPVLELALEAGTDAPPVRATALRLENPRPNPFNPATEIAFDLPRGGAVRVSVHDTRGRLVRVLAERHFAAGRHRLRWDGTDGRGAALASGVYLVRAESSGLVAVRRAVLVR